jgi:hypothetical protein
MNYLTLSKQALKLPSLCFYDTTSLHFRDFSFTDELTKEKS